MAARLLNRRAMREQHDQAGDVEQDTADAGPTDVEVDGEEAAPAPKKPRRKAAAAKSRKEKAPARPRVRKKTVKAAPRMVARWAVCDGGLKRVAVFEYRDRAGADARLAEVREKKAGSSFCLQLVKDPYDPPAPAEPVAAV